MLQGAHGTSLRHHASYSFPQLGVHLVHSSVSVSLEKGTFDGDWLGREQGRVDVIPKHQGMESDFHEGTQSDVGEGIVNDVGEAYQLEAEQNSANCRTVVVQTIITGIIF